MQGNPDQEASARRDVSSDLRTSSGDIVRRTDLEMASREPDPGAEADARPSLAKAALAGDQAALDEFHDLVGLALPGVTEHSYKDVVRLIMEEKGDVTFLARTRGGYYATAIDADELVAWILSPDGRMALERRGVVVPPLVTDLPAGTL